MITYRAKGSLVFFTFLLLYFAILLKLYFVQILRYDFFKNLASKQYQISITQQPSRGLFLDRNGKVLVINKDSFAAFITPHKIKDQKKLEFFLKKHFNNAYERLKKSENKYFMYVKRNLSERDLELINKFDSPDINLIKEPSRFYPYKSLGTILGITDIDNNGLFGLELQYNKILAGEEAKYYVEKDARSKNLYFKSMVECPGKEGESIKLTIDADLQFLAHQELKETVKKFKAKDGAVVIMDPENGNILTMVSYPDFNPNNVSNVDMEKTKNKCITEAYELGSVMKVFVALAALQEDVVKIDEEIDCENKKETYINGMKFSTVYPDGKIPFFRVMEVSNNIGMAKVAMRLGPKLFDHYKKFGFGIKTGIFAAEQPGFITPVKNWSKRSIISLSFGYEITCNLVQLAKAFSIIANGGYDINPKLFVQNNEKIKFNSTRLYSEESIDKIKEILKGTVEKGTAKKAMINGYNIMGKTGTANMLINGAYSFDHNLYTFSGFIEKDNYKRVIVTFIKDSELTHIYASSVAAPLFNRVAEKMLIHEKIIN